MLRVFVFMCTRLFFQAMIDLAWLHCVQEGGTNPLSCSRSTQQQNFKLFSILIDLHLPGITCTGVGGPSIVQLVSEGDRNIQMSHAAAAVHFLSLRGHKPKIPKERCSFVFVSVPRRQ